MKQEITCIGCPRGCQVTVDLDGDVVKSVTGNGCARGDKYARQECLDPRRMVTALVVVAGASMPLSVKTREAIPKNRIDDCLAAIREAKVTLPVHIGDVIIPNVLGCGVDVIATRELVA